jgi:hypothetical protein
VPRQKLATADESLFWYFVNERHRIYVKKASGQSKPWTEDRILQSYKFTNVFRQLDTGTVWLTDNIIKPHYNDDAALMIFNVSVYRLFNWTGTGEIIGWQTAWRPKVVTRRLKKAEAAGDQIFTGAHIVWSEGGMSKIDGIIKQCTDVWTKRVYLASITRYTNSLRGTFDELVKIRGIGSFIAYEIVSDLRHTRLLQDARDINTWANVGPGAMRGLRRLNPDIKPKQALAAMIDLLERSRENTGDHVPDMELRDIEHVLCEMDKFCRVKYGEGKPRSTYPGK